MPRFFDDYSNTYLTHDSSAGRKQQRRGWKFRENFRLHYQKHVQDWRRGEMGLASAQQSFIRTRGKDDPAIPPLPDGWKESVDDVTGISYYINTKTGKRTWVRPGFIPPPPGQAQQAIRTSGGPPRHNNAIGPPQQGGQHPNFRGVPPMVGSQPPIPPKNMYYKPNQPQYQQRPSQQQGYGQHQQQYAHQGPPPPPPLLGNLPPPPLPPHPPPAY